MPLPNLELQIAQHNGATTANLRLVLTNTRIDLVSAAILLDEVLLRTLRLEPDSYGAALTAMVFVPPLREAWQRALGYAEGGGQRLRLRIDLSGADALHALRWELLHDPLRNLPLARSERVVFSRYLSSEELGDLLTLPKPRLHALVAVSAAAGPAMHPVDVAGEVGRALAGLGSIPTTVLDGREGRTAATLPDLAAALRDEPAILYLVCHGSIVDHEPYLYLERQPGEPNHPLPGSALVEQIRSLSKRPLLVVLAACQGAGNDAEVLQAVGPSLARAGVGAVIAMASAVPMALVAALVPRLFGELARDGQIDRALAVARAGLPADQPWWLPTLWMATTNGALWDTPPGGGVFQVPYPKNPLFRGRDAELRKLAELLLSEEGGAAAVLPALAGTGGIGKTQLASEFAHAYQGYFPGGVFWLNMAQPEAVPSQVAAAGGPGGLDLPGWAGLEFADKLAAVRRAWSEPIRRLLVLDNLEEPGLLNDVRPVGGGTRLLITTRRGRWTATSNVQQVALQSLARPDSVRLLLAPRWRDGAEAALADTALAVEADAICAAVGDLPLALALAGAYLEQSPRLSLKGYRARLEKELLAHPSLEAELEEELPTRHAPSIRATIALSYARLDPQRSSDALALALLRRMAQLASAPVPLRLLVRLIERDPDDDEQLAEIDAPLRRLVSVGLVDLNPDGSALVHRLVAAYVRGEDSEGGKSMERAAAELISEVYMINEVGYPLEGAPYLPHLTHFANDAQLEGKQQATLLNSLGYLLKDLGELAAARPLHERALAIRDQALGPTHPHTAVSLNNLGTLLQAQGELAAARPYLERALAIVEHVLGPTHLDTATSLNNLGMLLQDLGELAAARLYLEQALAIREHTIGPTHPDMATSLNNLGMLLKNVGDLAAARPLYERALAIREQVQGLVHFATATSLNNLGTLLQAQGELMVARPYLERALAIREQVLGPTHPDTLTSLNNLGTLLQELGELVVARPHLERALVIVEQTLGTTHPDTAGSLNNLGLLLQELGELAAARHYLERALAIFTERLGPQHPHTLVVQDNLAVLGESDG
jgi:tetratricopeptide (TPR) repeat protein